jgi:D-sedoheptulose 7-phosphate isomerase
MQDSIEKEILHSAEVIKESISLKKDIEKATNLIIQCLKNGKKIIIFGNGGSAADAQHIAAELIGRYKIERKSYPAISLSTDTSVITSLSNDYSYDMVFERQCESLVTEGDIVIGISTSGKSKNVKNGLIMAKKKNAKTISLLGGNGGDIKNFSDISIIVNSTDTPRIQEVHRVIYHIICGIVEKELSK